MTDQPIVMATGPANNTDKQLLVSYFTLRRLVGLLAVSFPIALMIWGALSKDGIVIRSSMSDYYNSGARDFFVGVLFSMAVFLVTYKGYGREVGQRITDNLAGNVAGIAALGVAFFPTGSPDWRNTAHGISAFVLILALAWFCFFLFTIPRDSDDEKKKKRNFWYRVCGGIILGCVAAAAINHVYRMTTGDPGVTNLIFYVEWIALWAFGASWFIKGQVIKTWAKEKAN